MTVRLCLNLLTGGEQVKQRMTNLNSSGVECLRGILCGLHRIFYGLY